MTQGLHEARVWFCFGFVKLGVDVGIRCHPVRFGGWLRCWVGLEELGVGWLEFGFRGRRVGGLCAGQPAVGGPQVSGLHCLKRAGRTGRGRSAYRRRSRNSS